MFAHFTFVSSVINLIYLKQLVLLQCVLYDFKKVLNGIKLKCLSLTVAATLVYLGEKSKRPRLSDLQFQNPIS
jgi:hypothetical protein